MYLTLHTFATNTTRIAAFCPWSDAACSLMAEMLVTVQADVTFQLKPKMSMQRVRGMQIMLRTTQESRASRAIVQSLGSFMMLMAMLPLSARSM